MEIKKNRFVFILSNYTQIYMYSFKKKGEGIPKLDSVRLLLL